ncbi:MAG: PilZ domain-containing protein [Gemmataceae bacterium]|nr:PilZ domain-containing protein [Gemmataceae bacterium]
MFERTFSFWRRWVGHPESASAVTATAVADSPADERRFWVRYPADLKTSVQLGHSGQPFTAPAQLRDISQGGANFVLDREIQAGCLVNLELPLGRDGAMHTVLACIVRATAEADGRWALGCVFSRELTDDELSGFGARRVRHDDPAEQRVWMRFNCNLTARFQKIDDPNAPVESARVLNLSASGVGLLVDHFVDAGTLLTIDLTGKDGRATRTILACVVHVNQQSAGAWALGCNFIRELTDEDLQALI